MDHCAPASKPKLVKPVNWVPMPVSVPPVVPLKSNVSAWPSLPTTATWPSKTAPGSTMSVLSALPYNMTASATWVPPYPVPPEIVPALLNVE